MWCSAVLLWKTPLTLLLDPYNENHWGLDGDEWLDLLKTPKKASIYKAMQLPSENMLKPMSKHGTAINKLSPVKPTMSGKMSDHPKKGIKEGQGKQADPWGRWVWCRCPQATMLTMSKAVAMMCTYSTSKCILSQPVIPDDIQQPMLVESYHYSLWDHLSGPVAVLN